MATAAARVSGSASPATRAAASGDRATWRPHAAASANAQRPRRWSSAVPVAQGQPPAVGRVRFPVVERVLPGRIKSERARRREEERKVRDRCDTLPEGDGERDRTADDEQPADEFAPQDVPLFHERGEPEA